MSNTAFMFSDFQIQGYVRSAEWASDRVRLTLSVTSSNGADNDVCEIPVYADMHTQGFPFAASVFEDGSLVFARGHMEGDTTEDGVGCKGAMLVADNLSRVPFRKG